MPAVGYAGPPAWHLSTVATSWQFESAVVAVTAAAAACYLAGVLTVRLRGEPWAPSRTLAFLGGLVLWVVVCCSGIGVYE
ncbi:copper resistance protein CopD, partial [Streptacidiphilus pinicola]